jgi:DNA-binding CsgD family transcriptional regulator
MPHEPYKYVIQLTQNERSALEQLVKNGKTERRLADRARILLWADDGLTLAETQRRLQCSEQTVLNWRVAFLQRRQEGPVEALRDRPRPGRPPSFSP